jgi:hypothetical protein
MDSYNRIFVRNNNTDDWKVRNPSVITARSVFGVDIQHSQLGITNQTEEDMAVSGQCLCISHLFVSVVC